MANIIIATPELGDTSPTYASSETEAGPLNNLRKMQPSSLWQSTDTAPWIEIDLGVAQPINLLALLHTNLTNQATVRVRTAATRGALTSAPVDDTYLVLVTAADGKRHAFLYLETAFNQRWVRLDISDATNPYGVIYAGRLFVSNALTFQHNYKYGMQDGYDDDSTLDITDGGVLIPAEGANRAVLEYTLNLKGEAERHLVRELHRKRGASKDVLVVTDPQASINLIDRIYHGLLQRRRVAVNTYFNRHTVTHQLTSLEVA